MNLVDNRKISYLILFLSYHICSSGTTDTVEHRYRVIEYFFENIETVEKAEFAYNLEELITSQINLNSADYQELSKLPFISSYQIKNLLAYRYINGNFITIWELLEIDGFDKKLLKKLDAFCIIDLPKKEVKYFDKITNNITLRDIFLSENRYGIKNKSYLGNKHDYFLRYTFYGSKNLRFGITCEKDEGEPFFKLNNNKGFDFYSAFFEIKKVYNHIDFWIGDFSAQFAQGNTLWSGYKINKSLTDVYITFSKGINAHRGVEENRFFRGVASKIYFKNWSLYLFYSHKNVDATLENDTIKSLIYSGLHRTKNEIEKKHNVKKVDFAQILEYDDNKINFGVLSNYTKLSKPLFPDQKLHKRYTFLGKQNFAGSIYYNFKLDNFEFFGEESISNHNGYILYNGFLLYPSPEYKFLVSHRFIDKNFYAFYNCLFVSSPNSSEHGIYFKVYASPFSKVSINAYLDYYKYNWSKYNLYPISFGKETSIQINYRLNNFYSLIFRYLIKDIPIIYNNKIQKNLISTFENKQNLRLQLDINKYSCSLSTRIEKIIYKNCLNEKHTGFLIYQNIKFYVPYCNNMKLYIRYVLFNSEGWNTRIYAYEDDFVGLFNNNVHHKVGSRYYFMLKYILNKNFILWSKMSQTIYTNENFIASGNSSIKGNKQTEFKLQLDITF